MNNHLFDLKIKELQYLNQKYDIINDILIIYEKNRPVMTGCKHCYLVVPVATIDGFEISEDD